MDLYRGLQAALAAAADASWVLRERYAGALDISLKAPRDLVTDADTAAEEAALSQLRKSFPDVPALAEESGGEMPERGFFWILDPLDGTTNYSHSYPLFSVSIALAEAADTPSGFSSAVGVVANPLTGDVYHAVRGEGAFFNGERVKMRTERHPLPMVVTSFHYETEAQLKEQLDCIQRILPKLQSSLRRGGSAALEIADLALGRVDAYWEFGVKPWDVAAAMLLVREAGGMAEFYRRTERERSLFVAGKPPLVRAICEELVEDRPELQALLDRQT